VEFSRRFYREIGEKWPQLAEQWQLFMANIEYGYDIERETVQYKPGEPLASEGAAATVAAGRGWQSSGISLEGGTTYGIAAAGRYQVANQPKIWWCEPGGVTIRYWRGRPLGMLLGAVRDDKADPARMSPLVKPFGIGLGRTVTPPHAGTLYLRVNDSPAELSDNAGEVTVRIRPK